MYDENRIFFKTKPWTAKSTGRPLQGGRRQGHAADRAKDNIALHINSERVLGGGVPHAMCRSDWNAAVGSATSEEQGGSIEESEAAQPIKKSNLLAKRMRLGTLRGLSCSDRASHSKEGSTSTATHSRRVEALSSRQQCVDPRGLRGVQLLTDSKKMINQVTKQLLERQGDSASKPELPVPKGIRYRHSRTRR